eukprot:c8835_g1_i1.p1 GENE.c8835_g1_i1~~c8835_g1_i1.p1  ORF type:complete len:356 (+),score=62.06 c8835_g1_i1:43-1068(+)
MDEWEKYEREHGVKEALIQMITDVSTKLPDDPFGHMCTWLAKRSSTHRNPLDLIQSIEFAVNEAKHTQWKMLQLESEIQAWHTNESAFSSGSGMSAVSQEHIRNLMKQAEKSTLTCEKAVDAIRILIDDACALRNARDIERRNSQLEKDLMEAELRTHQMSSRLLELGRTNACLEDEIRRLESALPLQSCASSAENELLVQIGLALDRMRCELTHPAAVDQNLIRTLTCRLDQQSAELREKDDVVARLKQELSQTRCGNGITFEIDEAPRSGRARSSSDGDMPKHAALVTPNKTLCADEPSEKAHDNFSVTSFINMPLRAFLQILLLVTLACLPCSMQLRV